MNISTQQPTATIAAMIIITVLLSACASTPKSSSDVPKVAAKTAQIAEPDRHAYAQALADLEKNPAAAAATLAKIANANAGYTDVWINAAVAYYRSNQIEAAKLAINHANALEPRSAHINNIQGLICVEEGLYLDAEKYYQASLAIDPKQPNTHYNLALLYDNYFQDLARAIAHYESYQALSNQKDEATETWKEELKQTLLRREKP